LFLVRPAGARKPIGEKSIGTLYDRAGFEGRHVPHGWRASFSTVMNERGADGADVERALAHTPKDKVKAAYDRSERLQRQRNLFQEWADLLVDL
jgi:integrase